MKVGDGTGQSFRLVGPFRAAQGVQQQPDLHCGFFGDGMVLAPGFPLGLQPFPVVVPQDGGGVLKAAVVQCSGGVLQSAAVLPGRLPGQGDREAPVALGVVGPPAGP